MACKFCLDTGKFFGWSDGHYVLIDCTCGHKDNPIKSKDDPRREEFNRTWDIQEGKEE